MTIRLTATLILLMKPHSNRFVLVKLIIVTKAQRNNTHCKFATLLFLFLDNVINYNGLMWVRHLVKCREILTQQDLCWYVTRRLETWQTCQLQCLSNFNDIIFLTSNGQGPSSVPWWRRGMKTLSASLALCDGNHLWPVVSPHKGPVMWSLGVYLVVSLSELLRWDKVR